MVSRRFAVKLILSIIIGILVALLIFFNTDHEYVYKELINSNNDKMSGEISFYEDVNYNYKPAIIGFIITTGLFLLLIQFRRKK